MFYVLLLNTDNLQWYKLSCITYKPLKQAFLLTLPSGIAILVKCDQVKNLVMATTNEHGLFETQLPSSNCKAKIFGGPKQLYVSRKNMVTSIKIVHETDSYTTSQPLSFYTSCPLSQNKNGKCGAGDDAVERNVGSSKTVDLPLPREWGFAPTSYYFPGMPIIGIP